MTEQMPFQVPEEIKKRRGDTGKVYDIIIIGGGPAGMTAAVYASRKKLDVLMITTDLGGQVLLTSSIENYLGYQYITGRELSDKFGAQVHMFKIDLEMPEKAAGLEFRNGFFEVRTGSDKAFRTRSVVIASGKRSRPLNVPGETELIGRGVTYCSVCDAPLFKGMTVCVVGGGNSAVSAAIDLTKYADKIYLVNIMSEFACDRVLLDKVKNSPKVEILRGMEVTKILGKDLVTGIILKDVKTGEMKSLPLQGVFIEIGLLPNSDFANGVVVLNKKDEIVVDCACKTSRPGIFACGDVTSVPEKQIIIAAGEGAKASLAAYRYVIGLNE
jgi:alkyl hydroperoxide reductase subunit F